MIPRAKYRRTPRHALWSAVVWAGCGGGGSDGFKTPDHSPPAIVANPTTEQALTTVTLSPEAIVRIGIETVKAEIKDLRRTRTLGGEIVLPEGAGVTVTAPRAGVIIAPQSGSVGGGDRVNAGTPIFRFIALPADADLSRLREQVAVVDAQRTSALARMERTRSLRRDSLASAQALEDATLEVIRAEEGLRVARALLQAVAGNLDSAATAALSPLALNAPRAGIVSRLHVAAGQAVASGAPLFDLVALDTVWVRVPVYVGELPEFDRARGAEVTDLRRGSGEGSTSRRAAAITGPLSADPLGASADLHFMLANTDLRFRPGQRVGAVLTLRSSLAGLVVPWAAVVYDINGGTWVYEAREGGVFVRRRVAVAEVVGEWARITAGIEESRAVVSVGAAELYSVEFGVGH